ncbi:hypothetical protein M3699_10055 [Peribacillus simplex]|uniref:hypothetical protein n=1 Tax=Peribacillus simplex TaxID=1478 RepID=UPI00203E0CB8|nr:hypothetical protein [Peribacillus simplex]MCM3674223.1 hypothetical protein [Peribacillus simplex]
MLHQVKHSIDILPIAVKYDIPLIVHFRGRDSSTQIYKRFRENVIRYQHGEEGQVKKLLKSYMVEADKMPVF